MLLTMESKTAAHHKLEALIEKGRTTAGNVIQHVMTHQPTDHLARGAALKFEANPEATSISVAIPESRIVANSVSMQIHRNALVQLGHSSDLPLKFISSLQDTAAPWGRDLLAHNLNTVFTNRAPKARYLLRSLGGELRGFLSDRYRRLDSRPIIEAFASAVQRKGALPYDGYVTDTKIAIQAIMPEVYEPIPGEMVAYGLSLENSDFGNGALSVRAYLLRIWCSNLAITQEQMRQVHLGKRLDDSMLYSNRTYELDAKTTVSALRDVIDGQLDADSLKHRMEAIRYANEQSVDPRSAKETFRRLLQKGESEAATQAFESPDTYNLPPGNTNWRLSNAISWVAGQTKDAERKLDLMKIAGEVLPKAS